LCTPSSSCRRRSAKHASLYPAHGKPRAILTVGHGTATGIEAPDLHGAGEGMAAGDHGRARRTALSRGPVIPACRGRRFWTRCGGNCGRGSSPRAAVIAGDAARARRSPAGPRPGPERPCGTCAAYPLNGPGAHRAARHRSADPDRARRKRPFGRQRSSPRCPLAGVGRDPQADHVSRFPTTGGRCSRP